MSFLSNTFLNGSKGSISHALQDVKPENWNSNPGYSFEIVNWPPSSGGSWISSTLNSAFNSVLNTTKYRLQLNPQSITQSEPFSINIIPTQTGVASEHQGFVTKDLVISGTTGILPFKSVSGPPVNGIIPQMPQKTGYQEFLDFRNFIRSYAELKTIVGNEKVKLLYKNFKDNEFWYVEPLKFEGNRNKDRPFLYDYNVQFKIVGKYVDESTFGFLTTILNDINAIEKYIDRGISVLQNSVEFLQNIEQDVETTLFAPLKIAQYAIQAMASGKNVICSLPRKFFNNLMTEVGRVKDNFCDFVGIGDSTYNSIYDRVDTLSPIPPGTTAPPLTFNDTQILKAFADVENSLNKMLANDSFFEGDSSKVTENNTITGPDSILSSSEIEDNQIASKKNILAAFNNEISLPTPPSVQQAILNGNETLESVAARYLGDATRWIEIVALNKLKPPYVSDTSGDGVLTPGTQYLLPGSAPVNRNQSTVVNNRLANQGLSLTDKQKAYGIDLRVDSNFDLVVNNRGDLDLTAGFDNIIQAIQLKLGYERGSLLYHPEVGVGLYIGNKDEVLIDELAFSIKQTILADSRFGAINSIKLTQENGAIYLYLNVVLEGTNQEAPLVLEF